MSPRGPHIAPRLLGVLIAAGIIGCSDDRQSAAKELLEFAQKAPWTLASVRDTRPHWAVVVRDSSLPAYNDLFKYFDPGDSTRGTLYRALPTFILLKYPVTTVGRARFQSLGGDTLLALIPFSRPDTAIFTSAFAGVHWRSDTMPPTDQERTGFESALALAARQLQQADTAVIRVVKGPRIVGYTTTLLVRDSIVRDSLAVVATLTLKSLVATARIDVKAIGTMTAPDPGGTVRGSVTPGSTAWPRGLKPDFFAEVECEASRDGAKTLETSYLLFDKAEPHEPVDFLCLWYGESGKAWQRIDPNTIRTRLTASVYGSKDSVFGDWVSFERIRHLPTVRVDTLERAFRLARKSAGLTRVIADRKTRTFFRNDNAACPAIDSIPVERRVFLWDRAEAAGLGYSESMRPNCFLDDQ